MTAPTSTIRQTLKPIIAVGHVLLALFWATLVPYFYYDLDYKRVFYAMADMAPIEAVLSQTREPAIYANGIHTFDVIRTRIRIRPVMGLFPSRELNVTESVSATTGESRFKTLLKAAASPNSVSIVYVDTDEAREAFELLNPADKAHAYNDSRTLRHFWGAKLAVLFSVLSVVSLLIAMGLALSLWLQAQNRASA